MKTFKLLTDAQLIERVVKSDHAAFAELVQRYLAVLVKFSTRYTLSFSTSEDIVQEAFINVWRKASGWSDVKGSVKSWLFKIVYNATIDALRKQRNSYAGYTEAAEELTCDNRPDDILLQAQQQQWLVQAMNELPERQRTALCLFMNNGLSVAEVASVLNLNDEAAGSLMARAKRNLKNKMQDDRKSGVC